MESSNYKTFPQEFSVELDNNSFALALEGYYESNPLDKRRYYEMDLSTRMAISAEASRRKAAAQA